MATREGDYEPCGLLFVACERYHKEMCLGCPATRFTGTIFRSVDLEFDGTSLNADTEIKKN